MRVLAWFAATLTLIYAGHGHAGSDIDWLVNDGFGVYGWGTPMETLDSVYDLSFTESEHDKAVIWADAPVKSPFRPELEFTCSLRFRDRLLVGIDIAARDCEELLMAVGQAFGLPDHVDTTEWIALRWADDQTYRKLSILNTLFSEERRFSILVIAEPSEMIRLNPEDAEIFQALERRRANQPRVPDGFKGHPWGDSFAALDSTFKLVFGGELSGNVQLYATSIDRLADIPLAYCSFLFYKGEFSGVSIGTKGSTSAAMLKRALTEAYGEPVQENQFIDEYTFHSRKTLRTLTYDELSGEGSLFILSLLHLRQKEKDAEEAAEKAASEF